MENNLEYQDLSPRKEEKEPESSTRNIIGFFILGLVNNFAYVVFLSAAEHMIPTCTGCILLADVVPSVLIGLVAPFFMHYIPYNIRILVICAFSLASFQFVAWFDHIAIKTIGVACGSIACGLGEITFLAMSSYYNKDVLVGWVNFIILIFLGKRNWCCRGHWINFIFSFNWMVLII